MQNAILAAALMALAYLAIKALAAMRPQAYRDFRRHGISAFLLAVLGVLALKGSVLAGVILALVGAVYAGRAFLPGLALALLKKYFDGRLAGWREAEQGQGQARRMAGNDGAMTSEEAHQVLGLQPEAFAADILRAHRQLMKKLHPDRGGSNALAARVNQAKDVLMRRQRQSSS